MVNTVSTVLVGHLGARDLAAVGLAVSLANVTGYSVMVGVATTLGTTAGQAFGARNWQEVSLQLQRCLLPRGVVLVFFQVRQLVDLASGSAFRKKTAKT